MDTNSKFSLETLRNLCNDDRDFMKEMIEVFLRIGYESLDELNRANSSAELESVGSLAHKMKSSVQIIGNKKLFSLLKKIEKEAKKGDPEAEVEIKISELNHLMEELKIFLTKCLENPSELA